MTAPGPLGTTPAVWAGPECAFLTVGSWACDQLAFTGHDRRLDDLDRLAGLGVRAIRLPILWGRGAGAEATDWAWAGERLARLSALGVEPLVGLLHHGFGPAGADPLDPGWPAAFGRYAAEVVARFPEVRSFLPINEPLTTARFGALYGWWPPYARDRRVFGDLILAQAIGWIEAAAAIRASRSDARLLVNEDVGRTYASPGCVDVAAAHNDRRWLTYDLLTGLVEPGHPAWPLLATSPARRRSLDRLRREPGNPDVLGVDHYVTSDRYLDDDLDRFPDHLHAVEGNRRYVDVELARVGGQAGEGFRGAIRDTWQRYGLPVALTEVQLAGEPDDQVGWWAEAWQAAGDAAASGVPVVGVTAWSVFGAYDWSSVLRNPRGAYEAGCFDVSTGQPVETRLAAAVRRSASHDPTATDAEPAPVGWWRRPDRVLYEGAAALVP